MKDIYNVYGFTWSLMIFALEVIPLFAAKFTKLSNIADPYPRILKWHFNKRLNKPKIRKHITWQRLVPYPHKIDRWYFQDIMQVPCLYQMDGIQTENMHSLDDVAGSSDMVQQATIGGNHANADVPDDKHF
ncbi:hypothetical protein ACOSP7_013673 [Xanthoceras sorbifolium]